MFLDHKIIPERKTYVLNGAGVNLQHFRLLEYPSDETIHFLFIGRVMKEKGIEELFSAMKMLITDGISCSLSLVGILKKIINLLFPNIKRRMANILGVPK